MGMKWLNQSELCTDSISNSGSMIPLLGAVIFKGL